VTLLTNGRGVREVARMVGCSGSSVVRWREAHRKGGVKALESKPTPGRPRKLIGEVTGRAEPPVEELTGNE